MPSDATATREPLYKADAISTSHHVNHINDTMECECSSGCGWIGEVECLTEWVTYDNDRFGAGGHYQTTSHGQEQTTEFDCPKCGEHNKVEKFNEE